jgi:hypothetical protein
MHAKKLSVESPQYNPPSTVIKQSNFNYSGAPRPYPTPQHDFFGKTFSPEALEYHL